MVTYVQNSSQLCIHDKIEEQPDHSRCAVRNVIPAIKSSIIRETHSKNQECMQYGYGLRARFAKGEYASSDDIGLKLDPRRHLRQGPQPF